MAEANPDPSGSTGEFRAFVERGQAERQRRSPMMIVAVLVAVVIVAVIVALAVH